MGFSLIIAGNLVILQKQTKKQVGLWLKDSPFIYHWEQLSGLA